MLKFGEVIFVHIRKTEEGDLLAIAEIYSNAKRYMTENGNPNQWNTENSPSLKTAREDMENGVGYVCERDGEIIAVFMFKIGEDPTYKTIYDGKWLNDDKYAVIHRIAVKYHGQGIVAFCFNECFSHFPNLKIDTHRDNIPMQKALGKAGFLRCGIIHLENGDERIAFQKQNSAD